MSIEWRSLRKFDRSVLTQLNYSKVGIKMHGLLYSVQPKVSIRVDGATELGVRGSQSAPATLLMSGNSRAFAAAASDWLMSLPNSVAPSTRIETFG